MFEVKELNVAYGHVQVLWDVFLKVEQEEIVALIGPNGAGKSTLLRTAVGLLRPQRTEKANSITYRNKRIDRMTPEQIVRLGIALVTEEKHLFAEMTVIENLKMGSYIERARRDRQKSLDFVYSLFPILAERRNQFVRTLSGGEAKMLAIGRALMSKPELLLVDEPSLGLAPSLAAKTFDAILEIRQKDVTVVLVEQNVVFSLEISNRGYVLENGRIVMEGEGKELLLDEHIKKAYLAIQVTRTLRIVLCCEWATDVDSICLIRELSPK
jgi:branched-chain amino acid transport system ATP-binding protein